MLETLIAAVMLASLILYALMGGADYGGGMWDLLASGPRAQRQRHAIVEAIAPIWEANHVWLILVIVLLFTGFPRAFSTIMIALHIPITAMLIGIVLRGSAFVFRKYDSTEDAVQRRWSTIFGIASFFTPFFQGLTLGALTTGAIHFVGDRVTTGFFAGWLTPFALTCGLFALALFAFLAATYMTVDTQGQPDLQNDFRLRALWAADSVDPTGDHRLYYLKIRCPIHVPGPDQLVGAGPARMDGSERDSRNPGALVSEVLSGTNRCSGAGNLYSFRLGPGPISAPSHTGCHYSKRRCTRVDLKAFAAGPRSRSGRPAAVTSLSFSNLQRSRTALTPSSPSRSKPPTNRTCTCLHILNPTNQAEPSQQSALAPTGEATSRKRIITIPPPGGVPPLASLRS